MDFEVGADEALEIGRSGDDDKDGSKTREGDGNTGSADRNHESGVTGWIREGDKRSSRDAGYRSELNARAREWTSGLVRDGDVHELAGRK